MDAVVTVSHVNKSFNHKRILHDVNLTASTHEILGLIGPSGAGKTTIIKNIMGMEEPDDGDVTVFGQRCRTEKCCSGLALWLKKTPCTIT